MQNSKIGVGLITCNREAYLQLLIRGLKGNASISELIIVNDGAKKLEYNECSVINNEENVGVGRSKNKALRYLLERGCEYVFLIEDDVRILRDDVFERYILTSNLSGIQHFNFAYHGTDNYEQDGTPLIRLKIEYRDGVAVCLFPNVYGAFSFYTRQCLETCGFMDEYYYNALEHVQHTLDICKNNMHPPFRWFADIADSQLYVEELDRNHSNSEIRRDKKWIDNFHKAADYFVQKNGFDVRDPYAKQLSKEETIQNLKLIKKLYGKSDKN